MNETKTKRDKKIPAYHSRMKAEHTDELYVRILQQLSSGRRYREPSYTAKQLAADLDTNTRYISSAVATHTGDNYNALINGMRLRDACRMLRSPRFAAYTTEEIGLLVGFSSRQAFYLAFNRMFDTTPRKYRLYTDSTGKSEELQSPED